MDKASIVGDAIDYVKELKQEVEDIELEISEIERKAIGHVSVNESSAGSMLSDCEERASFGKVADVAEATVVTEPNDDNIVTDAAAIETENTKPLADISQGQPPVSKTRILNVSSNFLHLFFQLHNPHLCKGSRFFSIIFFILMLWCHLFETLD